MSSLSELLNKVIQDAMVGSQGAYIGKVTSFDKGNHTATIEPLLKNERGDAYPVLEDVHCCTLTFGSIKIQPSYVAGSYVICAVLHANAEDQFNAEKSDTEREPHALHNSVVLMGVSTNSEELPGGFNQDDFFMANSMGSGIKISGANVEFGKFANGVLESGFRFDGSIMSVITGGMMVDLFNHIHNAPIGPTAPPTPSPAT